MVVLHAFLLLVNLASGVSQKPLLYEFCIEQQLLYITILSFTMVAHQIMTDYQI